MANLAIQKDTGLAADRQAGEKTDERIYVSLAQLVRLQHKAGGFSFLPRQPLNSLLAGRHAAKVRGRGLNFEEIRAYLPGDDIRSIDWKVTARTRKPHLRVYTEERERPAYLVVDQRLAMFFGTRVRMKSVVAAETAALGAWRVLSMGDRAGAVVFNDTEITEVRPQRSRQNVMRILQAVVAMNHALQADLEVTPDPAMLIRALEHVRRRVGHDALITVISDFDGFDKQGRKLLLEMGQHNDVICALVHDPSAVELPSSSDYVITDGELQVELKLADRRVRRRVHEAAAGRIAGVMDTLHDINIPVLPLNTVEDVAGQVRHLLGYAPGSPRGRMRRG
jgi:uncharacterized protein (DUF58 family)